MDECDTNYDATGPGTPAWNLFDKALQVYCSIGYGEVHDSSTKSYKLYKAYTNYRYRMVKALKKAGLHPDTIAIWTATLTAECKGRAVDENGRAVDENREYL